MARLRDPKTGCPWDVAQNFASIAPYTIEEAYEVADAIARGDMADLRGELGDLLLQVVFHARIAEEAGSFDLDDVAKALAEKLIVRHPHVFGPDTPERHDTAAQTRSWEAIKAEERAGKRALSDAPPSALDHVPLALPAAMRAEKIQARASRVGFDWAAPESALDKVGEEVREVRDVLSGEDNAAARHEEIGDLLFAAVNAARLCKVDAEAALRDATRKFERRFRQVEEELARRGTTPQQSSLDEMDSIWNSLKIPRNQNES
jgi:MazG family protein